jgi:hypothetical protein
MIWYDIKQTSERDKMSGNKMSNTAQEKDIDA